MDASWEDLCLLMAEDESTPFADYRDLLPECVEEAEGDFADLPADAWQTVLDTPDERIEVGSNGVGRPQLVYRDESGADVARVEFFEGDDGLFYLKSFSAI